MKTNTNISGRTNTPGTPNISRATSILNSTNTSPIFLLSVSFLLSLLYLPPVDIFFDDKEIFSYFGRLIAKGSVPYKDAFDHKPPLIFFFNSLGPWGLWLIDTFLVGLASLLFFRLCRKYRLAWPWLLPLLFNLLLRNYLVCVSLGMTRAYTAIFVLLFVCCWLNVANHRYFWMGLLTAATFFMQQEQLLILLPFGLCALLTDLSPKIKNILLALAGAAAITAPILIYFTIHHALTYFWECAFRFNTQWYDQKVPLLLHFRGIKDALAATGCSIVFYAAILAGICSLFLNTVNKRWVTAALLAVLFSFSSEYLSGRLRLGYPFYYYLLPLCSTLPILLFTVWAGTREEFLLGKKSQGFYGLLICCLPFYNILQHGTHLTTHNQDVIKTTPEFTWLGQQHLKDYDLFVFGNDFWICAYNQWNILSPSRWVYQNFWGNLPNWDADHRQLRSITDDLRHHHTRYIINDQREFSWQDTAARDYWTSFLHQYYQPVTPLLWEVKPTTTSPQ